MEEDKEPFKVTGTLSKWTNYIQGWQSRFVVIRNGNLSYYKSADEQSYECRGVLCLHKAKIMPHELDACRFDVSIQDHTWYFRAQSPESKHAWVENLREMRNISMCSNYCGYFSKVENSLSDLKTAGTVDFSLYEDLKKYLIEITTHESILKKQVDTLQQYFNFVAEQKHPINWENFQITTSTSTKLSMLDFKREALCFRVATESVLKALKECVDAVAKTVELWPVDTPRGHLLERPGLNNLIATNPDVEGPRCTIHEDEFFDALESGFQRIEEEASLRELLKRNSICELPTTSRNASDHPLWPEIRAITSSQIHSAKNSINETWNIFFDEMSLRMFTKERVVEGVVLDPLWAQQTVRGVNAKEVCHYFFSPQYRQDWETTLEQMEVVEKISEDVLVFHQVHKRVWPAAQRDSLFWSHRLQVTNEASDTWAVVNYSTQFPKYSQSYKDCLRIMLTVCLYCQNDNSRLSGAKPLSRDDIDCKITYCSTVNPGGWAPAFALRAIFKKEYPKFLKRFSNYVINQTKDKPIML